MVSVMNERHTVPSCDMLTVFVPPTVYPYSADASPTSPESTEKRLLASLTPQLQALVNPVIVPTESEFTETPKYELPQGTRHGAATMRYTWSAGSVGE